MEIDITSRERMGIPVGLKKVTSGTNPTFLPLIGLGIFLNP
jgi:hypothetical protein